MKDRIYGRVKRFDRYFTVPINAAFFKAFEKLKWRVELDKTEIARRMIEYLLLLPPDSQDKILRSFDATRERETEDLKEKRHKEFKTKTFKKRQLHETHQELINHPEVVPKPAPVVRPVFKRSGLP